MYRRFYPVRSLVNLGQVALSTYIFSRERIVLLQNEPFSPFTYNISYVTLCTEMIYDLIIFYP